MATAIESAPRHPVGNERDDIMGARTIPIINTSQTPIIKTSAPSENGDPMDITTPTKDSSGRGSSRARMEREEVRPSGTQTATRTIKYHRRPKIVQTAFIHKLYNMLEDPNIQHLISWSSSAESFVMSPSHDFSKVLAQYFKHTNISSFVRQLNMYGFHKVSDVFHTGNPETALWEFKHGNGNFKRGDLVGLREIKRRASRHALVHREYNNQKPTPSQPGTPAEPMPPIPDGSDPRLAHIEHTLFDVNTRLQRSEEAAAYMHVKQQAMMDTLSCPIRTNRFIETSSTCKGNATVTKQYIPSDGAGTTLAGTPLSSRGQYFAGLENPPVSPRQLAQDDQRRPGMPQSRGASNFYRPPVPSNLSITSARRPYGSIGGGATTQSSPSPLRPQAPPPAPVPHPLSNVQEPPPGSLVGATLQLTSVPTAGSRKLRRRSGGRDQGLRNGHHRQAERLRRTNDFENLFIRTRSKMQPTSLNSRPSTPPPPPFSNGISTMDSFNNWSWGSASSRENKNLSVRDSSGPPTRRGSMAHILNPTDTAERDDEDDPRGDEDRKRKRLQ
ncbi:hypothetical protein PG994_001284 [Apiospora phragmitis]|uniref:HSF-type DNA-binding domain-containing protein n=1 Tax=Apiospora phragmitis TaxID=2905665 RepID=A0ABR1WT36_9PEZI